MTRESERCHRQAHEFIRCLFPIFVRWIFEDAVMMTSLGQSREGPQISRITAIESEEVLARWLNQTVVRRGYVFMCP